MKKWTRWEDWVAVVVGLAVALSALFVPPMGASVAMMVSLGILLIISGLVNLASPGLVAMEYVQGVLGLLLIISPWIGGYAGTSDAAAWVSWIGGAVVVIVAALAIRPSMRAHHDAITH
ncbi:SPW repeat protein [Agromyces sp. ISL-38]|uniref:SPW repeat domain-containing protein n=1 Tax=Agromyces sp. ISL-38 TaxID=2819107 RepID=UPI001BEB791D|nr:SPW repeat protein [Agromyces sp. ISL-38]MBT2500826.1 SPW repeat protein [Agromyces sp. ISL-38]MBT2519133.1 SPW repeat protein [Streptomyces sp. ISL-90]